MFDYNLIMQHTISEGYSHMANILKMQYLKPLICSCIFFVECTLSLTNKKKSYLLSFNKLWNLKVSKNRFRIITTKTTWHTHILKYRNILRVL